MCQAHPALVTSMWFEIARCPEDTDSGSKAHKNYMIMIIPRLKIKRKPNQGKDGHRTLRIGWNWSKTGQKWHSGLPNSNKGPKWPSDPQNGPMTRHPKNGSKMASGPPKQVKMGLYSVFCGHVICWHIHGQFHLFIPTYSGRTWEKAGQMYGPFLF